MSSFPIDSHNRTAMLNAWLEREQAAGTPYAEALRRFLESERDQLQAGHRAGLPGLAVVRRCTETIDVVLRTVCERAVVDGLAPWSVVAIGGYGRQELSPYSDLDLVLLSSSAEDTALEAFNQAIVHMLWDAGCRVGHAFRTVEEFLDVAAGDLATRTSLLEVRIVAGDAPLVETLRTAAHEAFFTTGALDFLEQKIEERRRRHIKFGESLYLQEPNIKESIGGLRDVHAVMWVVQALHGTMHFPRMRELGLLDRRQEKGLLHALDFFLRVRNELHFLLGRPGNVVELTHQPAIAAGLKIGPFRSATPDEQLMRLYYFHARNVTRTVTLLLERLRRDLQPTAVPSAAVAEAHHVADGFVVRDEQLEAEHARVFRDDPIRLIEVFALAQEHGVSLHPDLQLLVRASLVLLDRAVQQAPRAARAFLAILSRTGSVATTLRAMHELGVLGRYIPEFGKLTCLVQHDMHHRYTIDDHTLRCMAHLDQIVGSSEPKWRLYRQMFHAVSQPHVLSLGLLLHDVGKPSGADHAVQGAVLARRVCERLGLPADDTEQVSFLVEHHLLLAHTAFRRDLSDPAVVRTVVERVGTVEVLRRLFLLTAADIRSTAPELWNEWKEALLWDLTTQCETALRRPVRVEGRDSVAERRGRSAEARREIATILSNRFDTETIDRLIERLPQRLYSLFRPEYLARLVRLLHDLDDQTFVMDWAWDAERRVWNVAVCLRDRHGLLAELAGAFAVEEVNILDASINTLEGGLVLDVFRVAALAGRTPIDALFIDGVTHVFDTVLGGRADIETLLVRAHRASRKSRRKPEPPEIRFNNSASDRATLIEVRACDRVGLLHDMLRVLSDSGLDIDSAVITTDRGRVLDVFYVLADGARRLTDKAEQNGIRERLRQAVLREPDAPRN